MRARALLQRGWDWYRQQRRPVQLLIAAIVVIALFAALTSGGGGGGKTSTANTTSTHTTPTHTATPTGPHLLTDAVLGGPVGAFDAAYGQPDFTSGENGATRVYNVRTIAGHRVFLSLGVAPGTDGTRRVGFINIAPTPLGTTMSPAVGAEVLAAFLPTDAHFEHTLVVPDTFTERVYHSASLALSLPASRFVDTQTQQLVTPGTFSTACGGPFNPNGACQLQGGQ
jgi:hypothetical protein